MVEQLKDEGNRTQVVLSGATAGLVSRFVVAPLDVIKVCRFEIFVFASQNC
jgi:solute carrier family 25 (mitochondrial thiamine pyrophosphate transporter), member 19